MHHPFLAALATLVIAFGLDLLHPMEPPVSHQLEVILKQLLVIKLLHLLATIIHSYLYLKEL